MTISQDGVSVEVEEAAGDLHIDDKDPSALKIYVPMDQTTQGFCFSSPLPKALAEWLMKDPVTNSCETYDETLVTALSALFPIDIAVVDRCLDYHGIIQLPIPGDDGLEAPTSNDKIAPEPVEDGNTLPQQSETPESSVGHSSAEGVATPEATSAIMTSDGSDISVLVEREEVTRQEGIASHPPMPRVNRSAPVLTHSTAPSDEDERYLALLTRVITAAREATFPSIRPFNMASLVEALTGSATEITSFDDVEMYTRFRSTSQIERDKKIGAAGELYVYNISLFPILLLARTLTQLPQRYSKFYRD